MTGDALHRESFDEKSRRERMRVTAGLEEPEYACHQNQRGHVASEMRQFVSIIERLGRHDPGVSQARPDRERDQAAVIGRISCSGDEKNAQHGINSADHLQIVLALASVPHPTGGPYQTDGVYQTEDYAEGRQRESEQVVFLL